MGKIYHSSIGGNKWSKPYLKSNWLDHIAPKNAALAKIFFTKNNRGLPDSVESENVNDNAYCDGFIADKAIKHLNRLAKEKQEFFLAIGFRHPHLPWNAPKKYWDFYDRQKLPLAPSRQFPKDSPQVAQKKFGELFGYRDIPDKTKLTEALERQSIHGYYACVSYVDAQVGRLIQTLKKNNLYENTLIILWGDHGYHLGDNGVWSKGVNWEKVNHSPLMMRVPWQKKGNRVKALVEFVDIYPTICQAVGLPVPKHCEGKSLLPFVKNPQLQGDEFAFTQLKRFRGKKRGNAMGRSIRNKRYRFTIWQNEKNKKIIAKELYDYKTDPHGAINLANSPAHQQIVDELSQKYKENWPKPKKRLQ